MPKLTPTFFTSATAILIISGCGGNQNNSTGYNEKTIETTSSISEASPKVVADKNTVVKPFHYEIGDETNSKGLYVLQIAAGTSSEVNMTLLHQSDSTPVKNALVKMEVEGSGDGAEIAKQVEGKNYYSVSFNEPVNFPAVTTATLTIEGHHETVVLTTTLDGVTSFTL